MEWKRLVLSSTAKTDFESLGKDRLSFDHVVPGEIKAIKTNLLTRTSFAKAAFKVFTSIICMIFLLI